MKPGVPLQLAALLTIVLTNVVALGGAWWNRTGEAESRLALSQRELRPPWRGADRENSGLALALNWRVAVPGERVDGRWRGSEFSGGGAPDWLDKAKMERLGFDVSKASGAFRRNDRTLARGVLLVLELDGEAYQRSLEGARRQLAEEEAALAAMPDGNEKKARLKNAADRLAREEKENSRLFVVDAGRDLAELRAGYPDRARYAIVRGQVRPSWSGERGDGPLRGYVSAVDIAGINVPYALRPLLSESPTPWKFTAGVAFGRRLEPWIAQLRVEDR
ncbi:DUF4824 family protein [Propionivibrio sp.]|uniref:DUF4824 family protein n=1 Tax=Propionivibrio sp. TaxID=2212460 RepID=UPI0039E4872C